MYPFRFYICYNGTALEQWCAPGLNWDATEENCNWPELANCTVFTFRLLFLNLTYN